jgi:hypothetical protein
MNGFGFGNGQVELENAFFLEMSQKKMTLAEARAKTNKGDFRKQGYIKSPMPL